MNLLYIMQNLLSIAPNKFNNNLFQSLEVSGHSGYKTNGSDIVCSAISTAVFTSINLIDKKCGNDSYQLTQKEDQGYLFFEMINNLGFYEYVFVPAGHAVCNFVACDGDAHLPELVHEPAECMASIFRFLLVFSVYFYCNWKYFHFTVITYFNSFLQHIYAHFFKEIIPR